MTDVNVISCDVVRGCSICMRFKPERAHHCSRCRKCIKKMDHHCHWLGRCINYDNIGHFARFLLFTFLSNLFLLAANLYYIVDSIFITKTRVTHYVAAVAVVSTAIAGLLVAVCGSHCLLQFRMIANNTTYVEVVQRGGLGTNKQSFDSIYDVGLYENIIDVFGSPFLLFLGMPSGDGINFKKKFIENTSQMGIEDIDSDLFEHV